MAGVVSALTIAEEKLWRRYGDGGLNRRWHVKVLRDDSVPFKARVVGAISSKVVLTGRTALLS